ncbi:MAG: MarR family transcriptional regulator [Pseudolysinimonas sp.]
MAPDTSSIGYLVKHAQAALHSRMEDALRPLGLSVSQYACMVLVHEQPGISASELARGAFVTRQSMNALLRALIERGLVRRPVRADTGRALPTELTATGTELLGRAEILVSEVQDRMLSRLAAAERRALEGSLLACIDALA